MVDLHQLFVVDFAVAVLLKTFKGAVYAGYDIVQSLRVLLGLPCLLPQCLLEQVTFLLAFLHSEYGLLFPLQRTLEFLLESHQVDLELINLHLLRLNGLLHFCPFVRQNVLLL